MSKKKDRWSALDHEEHFWEKEKKDARHEKKFARSKDRSKYKKSDLEKYQKEQRRELKKKLRDKDLLRGRVVSIVPEGMMVDTDEEVYRCTVRGLLKKEKTKMKNLVTVGDFVLFEPMPGKEGSIAFVEPRKSTLIRAETLSHQKMQLIAANIDQVLITVSVEAPPLRPSIIDRYIIATKKGNMEPVVLINKIDLLTEEEKALYHQVLEAYRAIDIPVIPLSAKTEEGINPLKEVMKDKASVFSGQSGVGKSSLINAMTGLDLEVGETVEKTKKGAHTTTRASLIHLDFGGWVIDTPGIKSFGIWDINEEELKEYFPEFEAFAGRCKFPNCTHHHEPDCQVKKAVEVGDIASIRYKSYLALMEEIEEKHLRR